jgi:hypothetical protein
VLREGDVPRCRVAPAAPPADPDYDLVLYRYEWAVNGAPVRAGTFAGTADAVRRDAVLAGDTLSCTVTPTDGNADGPPVVLSARILGDTPLSPASTCTPHEGQAPLAVAFQGSVEGGVPPYELLWEFGDGTASSEPGPSHLYALPGTYQAHLTATDAVGEAATAPPLPVEVSPVPPAVYSATPLSSPFRLRLDGANFQEGIRAEVGGAPWPEAARKSETRLVLKGGRALKEALPRGVPVDITLTNPDGGSATVTYVRP